ncbi:uncharacterized protein LOC119279280 isoform X1 [Triticum dicoccoides]|uniref:uncharacterized protein LOC119279280 isoform X1 n=1 Tax=Triticum dicoccoides TaxID=85692 RepID=UPI00189040BA|nr:uncharacterized protein LOC119279280 isoform X1 [Triticum dicoccoides]
MVTAFRAGIGAWSDMVSLPMERSPNVHPRFREVIQVFKKVRRRVVAGIRLQQLNCKSSDELLRQGGAILQCKDEEGAIPLHGACAWGYAFFICIELILLCPKEKVSCPKK